MMTLGMLVLLLINAQQQLRARHTFTPEEFQRLSKIKSLGYYA